MITAAGLAPQWVDAMWNKIDHYLSSIDSQTMQIIMIVGVVIGAFLLRGWMSKNKY